jgi:hypothetical protein
MSKALKKAIKEKNLIDGAIERCYNAIIFRRRFFRGSRFQELSHPLKETTIYFP